MASKPEQSSEGQIFQLTERERERERENVIALIACLRFVLKWPKSDQKRKRFL